MVTTKEISLQEGPRLLDLNDDCLELILKRLNIVEQFQISKLHTRFKNIILALWRSKLNHVIIYPEILKDISDQTFIDFMLEVSGFMNSLFMRYCDIRLLRLLSDQIFPQTQCFNWMGVPANSGRDEENLEDTGQELQFIDEDVNMLVRIFPHLKLSLDECQFLDSDNFRDVFQELKLRKFDIMEDCDEINCCDLVELKKCPTLEHIKIADYHLCFDTDIVNDILRMPKLKKLSILSKNFVFDILERISRSRLKQIEAFKFNGVLHNFDRFFQELTHMRELKKLSFYECRGYDIEGIRDHMLSQISKQLPNLEEIHLCSCDLESENGVLCFVQNCRQLRIINLTSTHKCFNVSTIWRCMDLMKKQKWRTTALEIWLKDTDVNKNILEDPRYMYNNRFLKLDFKSFVVDSNPPGVLKFTFTT
ncbi:uncharacterized protein LOC119602015 isoform X2 [Lucilia sericata]|uniref:uncharacterized protein LOC119602015 isoform X2 n=1 Tax=Lucilia sericata TaxID=13632 RepID=UPI0018A7F32E|nr:uncharacterized protein LOC119602015 isoform X2 [Lucilia sericata]